MCKYSQASVQIILHKHPSLNLSTKSCQYDLIMISSLKKYNLNFIFKSILNIDLEHFDVVRKNIVHQRI